MREQLKKDLQKNFKFAEATRFQIRKAKQQASQATKQSKQTQNKSIIRSNKNIYYSQCVEAPLTLRHVFNFYNLLGINERAIRNQDKEQSYFKTMFYVKSINKVESRKNVLIFHLKNIEQSHIPIDYIVDRFKSFGNAGFYEVAKRMENLSKKLELMSSQEDSTNIKEEKAGDSLASFLQNMQNSMFMSKLGLNKLIISKSLLEFLGYDVEQFTIECLRYRAVINEILSTEKYAEVICKSLDNLKNLSDFLQNQISFDQYTQMSQMSYHEYLFTKDNRKVLCQLTLNSPNPLLNCIRVDNVLCQQEDAQAQSSMRGRYKNHSEQRTEQQIKLVRKLIDIPKNLLPENKVRIASYKEVTQESTSAIPEFSSD